jgi:pimeloyl-ACP methyl ester carboxylesterase
MVRTMNSANANRVVRWDFCLFLAGLATGVVLLDSAGKQAWAQTKPAAAKPTVAAPAAAKPAARPATQPGAAASQPAAAQGAKSATAPAKPAVPAKSDAAKGEPKDEPPPAPESFFVRTSDGWNIFCTFYGPKKGVRRGKDVVPIIMLHGWEGQGSEYADLATVLQSWGFASIVPDLRGHGRSLGVMRRKPNGEEEEKVVKADDLTPQDMEGMVNDVEAVRKVLVDKNDAQSLNLAMLCVVGSDVGTIVALNWSAFNWNQPVLPNGFRFGQDVKALVLLSPQQNFKRMNCSAVLTHPIISRNVSMLIAVGEQQNRDYSEAKRIHSRLERLRPPVAEEDRMQKQDLFLIPAPTPLQGTKLLDRALPVGGAIMKFLDLRLLRKVETFPWTDRKPPL